MRQDIRQELRKYQMDKIKPNFTELGRQLGCDPRTAKKYYYLKEDGCILQNRSTQLCNIIIHSCVMKKAIV